MLARCSSELVISVDRIEGAAARCGLDWLLFFLRSLHSLNGDGRELRWDV
jgi:hypothetical protein